MTHRVGVVGLGDMGSGLAKNLIERRFETAGFDLSGPRMEEFVKMGGIGAESASEVGSGAKAVFVMVLNGSSGECSRVRRGRPRLHDAARLHDLDDCHHQAE